MIAITLSRRLCCGLWVISWCFSQCDSTSWKSSLSSNAHDDSLLCPNMSDPEKEKCTDIKKNNWFHLKKAIENTTKKKLTLCPFRIKKNALGDPIKLTKDLHLQCIRPNECIIDGEGQHMIITKNSAKITLQGFTFTGASKTALGIFQSWKNVHKICHCSFKGNVKLDKGTIGLKGGAIKALPNTKVVIEYCRFYNNYAAYGGSIFNMGSKMIVSNSSFTKNEAKLGSAIRSVKYANISLKGNTFVKHVKDNFVAIETRSDRDAGEDGGWIDEGNNVGKWNGHCNGIWLDSERFCKQFASQSATDSPSKSPYINSESFLTASPTSFPTISPTSLTTTSSISTSLTLPLRGTFYYPWFPQTWTVQGYHVSYNPDLGYYSSDSHVTVDRHINSMDYGKIDVAIISWWGIDHVYERTRVQFLLDRTQALQSNLKWSFYYELEMKRDPTASEIKKNLEYLESKYTDHPAIAKIDGKPIIFVYNHGSYDEDSSRCEVTDRWAKANANGRWYIVLKVFRKYFECLRQPDAWHQYGPGQPSSEHSTSYVISPGFWRAGKEDPNLERDVSRWYKNVADMVESGKPWQLVTTFNEWGEGTAIESAEEWSSDSGYGKYLDALHTDGKI